jgi:hypothetical protein
MVTSVRLAELVRQNKLIYSFLYLVLVELVTVAARCKPRTVFACWNGGIVGSKPARGMDVCVQVAALRGVNLPSECPADCVQDEETQKRQRSNKRAAEP